MVPRVTLLSPEESQRQVAPGEPRSGLIDGSVERLAVVVVNFRTPDLTIACLESLVPQLSSIQRSRVIVVDNGSGDDSPERIRDAIGERGWSSWTTLVPLERNGGFAYGNNRGFEQAPLAEYYLLLNSDTVAHEGVLSHCLAVMDAAPEIGAMSCLVLNSDGTVQNVARRFLTPARRVVGALGLPWKAPRLFEWADTDDLRWDRRSTRRDVDWLGGAFLFVRGAVMRHVGPLDEEFFFYGEDVEFCHRIRDAGFRCRYDPGATITHHGGSSSDPSRMASVDRIVHALRGKHLVHEKVYGARSAAACLALEHLIQAAKVRAFGWARRNGPEREQAVRLLEAITRVRRPVSTGTTDRSMRT